MRRLWTANEGDFCVDGCGGVFVLRADNKAGRRCASCGASEAQPEVRVRIGDRRGWIGRSQLLRGRR